jgi:putative inorganic carbon (HCO3(-)) transporter
MFKIFLLLLGLTPLIVTPFTFELFEFPKTLFLYLSSTALFAYLIWPKKEKSFIKKLNLKKLWPIGLWCVFFLASFVFSQDQSTSFWGYYTRFNGGLMSQACFVTVFFFVYKHVNSKESKSTLIKTVLLCASLVSLYAILQHFGIDAKLWIQNVKLRVFATLGQPNWLASYLLLTMPLAAWLFFADKSRQKYKKHLLFVCFVVQFTAFWFTYSLSGIAGLLVQAGLFSTFFRKLICQNRIRALVMAATIFAIALSFPGPIGSRIGELKNIAQREVAAFAAEVDSPIQGGDTGHIRLLVWQGAIKLWLSSPKVFFIGSGPETFAFAFLKFRPEALNSTSEWDFLYNKAHNEYLNLLATQGVLGLGGYLALFYFAVRRAQTSLLNKALTVGLLGMSTSIFFGFHVIVTSLYFWTYLALLYQKDP